MVVVMGLDLMVVGLVIHFVDLAYLLVVNFEEDLI